MDMTRKEAYQRIEKLVDEFQKNPKAYKDPTFNNETDTKNQLINPFFEALGWDVYNKENPPPFQEVKYEATIQRKGVYEAPDYCFNLSGERKFFVEAKQPSVNLKGDNKPAYQVRRYGWNAGLPASILTDFEELSIYDCTKKPNQKDKPSTSRIQYLSYDKYLDKFDFLWSTLSKEAVRNGSLEEFIGSAPKKKGTETVDEDFLRTIEEWREKLAGNIAPWNRTLSSEEINYAVQKILDRIIFLRMCEDRGVEPDRNLAEAYSSKEVHKELVKLYREAEGKYNSGLFDFKEDQITPELAIDNEVLKAIIEELYPPNCEYEFSVMPVDILGSVYERFLGKKIRLTEGHHAKIEEKPEVRKAGGVYYTPRYIVDYIVQNTVGKLIEGETPKKVEKIKICDPACGSGSFLLGAYEYLLNWHRKYYAENPPKKGNNPLREDGDLKTSEKKRILLNNIHGVDIDPQAVEVTKLNLLLKALEGETKESIQLQMFHERVLPNLGENIKCGNSLINPKFYNRKTELTPEGIKNISAFDWEQEFPQTFERGGFDVVIGNPPYIQLSMYEWFGEDEKGYMLENYCSSMGRLNTFGFFIEKGINLLNKKGNMGYIIPNTLLTQDYYQPLRELILENTSIREIVNYSDMVFSDAIVETNTLFLSKQRISSDVTISDCKSPYKYEYRAIDEKVYKNTYKSQFLVKVNEESLRVRSIFDSVELKLGDIMNINQGIALKSDRSAHIYERKENDQFKPLLDGRDINRYSLEWPGNYLKYDKNAIHSCKREDIFLTKEKLFFRRVSEKLMATLDNEQHYALNTLVVMNLKENFSLDIRYILALFNSKALNWYYNNFFRSTKRVFSEIQTRSVKQLPIPSIDFSMSSQKEKHDEIVKIVNDLLKMNKKLQDIKLESQQKQIQRAIDHNERRVDKLIYDLYGLGGDEVKIIEEGDEVSVGAE